MSARAWLAILSVAAMFLMARVAVAAPRRAPRVAVVAGDQAAVPAAAAIAKALGARVAVIPVGAAAGAVGDAPDEVFALAREHGLHAIVRVTSRPARSKLAVSVVALQGKDGAALARYEVVDRPAAVAKAAARKAWRKLKPGLDRARAPTVAAVAVASSPSPPSSGAPFASSPVPASEDTSLLRSAPRQRAPGDGGGAARAARSPGTGSRGDAAIAATASPARGAPWLEVSASAGPFGRRLRYNDVLVGELRSYDLMASAVRGEVIARPLPGALGRWLAARARAELAVGVRGSRTSDGTAYDTRASEWSLGVRAEAPLRVRPALEVGYGEQRFAVDGGAMSVVPDVTYRWLGATASVRAPVTARLAIDARVGYRYLVGIGELATWFPAVDGAAVDAALGARVRLYRSIAMVGGVDLRRYFFAMDPEPGDARIAGGALDQYLTITAGLALALD